MPSRRVLRICLLALIGAQAHAADWESQLFPYSQGAGRYEEQTISFSGRDWRLVDFSFAGYDLGESSPGSAVPCNTITVQATGPVQPDGTVDIRAELQAAIDTLVSAGGGVVVIPAGVYTIGGSVAIDGDNIAIQGAGSERTILRVPDGYTALDDSYEGVFTFGKPLGGWNKGWVDRGDVLADVTSTVNEGDLHVSVDDASALSVGDWIVLRQYFWPALSAANSTTPDAWAAYNGWPDPTTEADRHFSFTYLRRIVGLNGLQVTVDAPVPWTLDPANNPVKLQSVQSPGWVAPHFNVGVAGLSMHFSDNLNAADGRPVGSGVYFEGVRDAWVYDVQLRNIPRFGIYLDHSARVSIVDSAVYDAQDYGGSGYGYAFHIQSSQNIRLQRCYSEEVRHGFLFQRALTSMLVLTETESAAARQGGDDTHHSFVHGLLWDGHRMTHGTGLHSTMRGSTSSGAYETHGSSTLWNVWGDGCRGGWYGGSLQLNPLVGGHAIVVGGPGQHEIWDVGATLGTGDEMTASAGLQIAPTLDTPGLGSQDQNVLYEGLFQPDLQPASLFATQWATRVGAPPADYAPGCGVSLTPGTRAAATYTGGGTLVFDSDRLGWVAHNGSGCVDCDRDTVAQNHTSGGAESLALTLSPADWSIATTFRGCPQQTADHTEVRLWVRPTSPDLEFRIGLRDVGLPEGNDVSLGNVLIDGLQNGIWNLVAIPLASFSPGTFNGVQVRSAGALSAAPFFIDDVLLLSNPPSSPPPVPDGSIGTPLLAARNDPAGSSLTLAWDTSTCGPAINHHLLYGMGSELHDAMTGIAPAGGAVCAVGASSPFTWNEVPDPVTDPSGLLWFLMVADDGGAIEGSWGADGAGNPRSGPGLNGSSGLCGMTDREPAAVCP